MEVSSIHNNHVSPDIEQKRMVLCNYHKKQMEKCSSLYSSLATELFFLQHGGSYTDFTQFIKRPSQQLTQHLMQNSVYSLEKHSLPFNQDVSTSQLNNVILKDKGSSDTRYSSFDKQVQYILFC